MDIDTIQQQIVDYKSGTDKYSIIITYSKICESISNNANYAFYTENWKQQFREDALKQLMTYIDKSDFSIDIGLIVGSSLLSIINSSFISTIIRLQSPTYGWLKEVKLGTIIRNTGSGNEYVVNYHNGKYPTVTRTITATNPSEWEIVN